MAKTKRRIIMGCGCKHGHGPNAFDLSHLEVGEGEVALPISAMFELGELEQEQAQVREGPTPGLRGAAADEATGTIGADGPPEGSSVAVRGARPWDMRPRGGESTWRLRGAHNNKPGPAAFPASEEVP